MLKIGIDARFAVYNRRGIGNYTLKLVQQLAVIDKNNQYILYIDRDDIENVLPKQDNFKIRRLRPSNYFIWEQVVLPMKAKQDAVDILHCPGNTAPVLLDREIKLVSSIMDVMYLKDYSVLPESASLYQRLGRFYRKAIVPRTTNHLSIALTISEFSKEDIIKHLPELAGKIKVVYLAANEGYRRIDRTKDRQKLAKFGLEEGCYILTLGALDPRKNTELVIKKYIELKSERKIKEKLVIVGIPNWRQTKFYDVVNKSSCKDKIIFTDFVSEEDLVLLYNCATVFLYPSLYEGFGIPPLEAMACGVPVITSNTTSIPEVVGDAALLINPHDDEELKNALLTLLNSASLRNDLINRGLEQAQKFSWRNMTEETLAIYKQVSFGKK